METELCLQSGPDSSIGTISPSVCLNPCVDGDNDSLALTFLLLKRKRRIPELPNSPVTTSAHAAAAKGDVSQLKQLAKENPNSLFEQDRNGWRPIHEAARAGHADVIDYLVKNGAAVNERTNDGRGATALWWAENLFDDDHPVILALRQHGAVNHGPVVDEL